MPDRRRVMRLSAAWVLVLSLVPKLGMAQRGEPVPDSYSMNRFPDMLASNTVGLVTRNNLLPLLVGTGMLLVSRPLDDDVQRGFGNKVKGLGDVGDAVGQGHVTVGAVTGLFIAGQVAPPGRLRRVSFDLAQGMIVNGVLTSVLKRAFGRQRPDSSNFRSFPSGHTSSAFTTATILARDLGPAVGVPAILFATFVGVSRLEDNKHFLSDIIAGGMLGVIVGRTVTSHGRLGGERRVAVTPFGAREGAGVLVQLSF